MRKSLSSRKTVSRKNMLLSSLLSASIVRYVIVGGVVFILDYSFNWLLIEVVGVNYLMVGYIVAPITLVTNFFLHRVWSFRDIRSNKGKVRRQSIRYIILVGFNMLANMLLMYLFYGVLGLPLLLARMGSIITMVLWNFPVYRIWVYRD